MVKNEECVIEVSKGASWEKEEALERVLRALLPELEQANDMFGVKKDRLAALWAEDGFAK